MQAIPLNSSAISGKRVIRIVTVPLSLKHLIKGQAGFFSQMGYQVTLVSADGPELEQVIAHEKVRHVVVPFTRKITLWQDAKCIFQLIRLFLRERPDIVHTQTPKAGLLGMIAGWICRVPRRIHTVGGLPIMTATGKRKFILQITERITSFCAHQVLANSPKMAAYMMETKLCSKKKLSVLGKGSSNGIDTNYFCASEVPFDKQQLRNKYNIPGNCFLFLFAGRIVNDKGISELANAFINLAEKYPHIWLLMVGPTEKHLDPVQQGVWDALKRHPRVVFTGYQSDVRPFMKMSDLLLFPSYREGFPNVPLQANAMELPTIVSDINGCNEIISHGKNGWIIPPKNTAALQEMMDYLLQHPLELEAMAAHLRADVVGQFSQQVFWKKMADFYDNNATIPFVQPQMLTPLKGGKFHEPTPVINAG